MESDEPELSSVSLSGAAIPEEGDFIGRYRVRERIGEGGMGLVYAAEDRELGRLVAIKLLRPVEGAEADVHRHRLLREAQALARVSHRNLVMVFDVGTHQGQVWIAMERVIGDTLEDWLAAERRTWEQIVDVFMEAGRGLVAVHEAGLVHRDFKPSNVIVRGDGTVQVLDFGLAAEAGETFNPDETQPRARPDLDALAATLTQTGGIMGTPAYMAPEQFLGLGADARSDQFSFCVALYEALYGERPFKGRDLPDLMVAICEGLPDLPPELPGVPELLRRTIARGLQSDREARFPDLEALLFALERSRAPAPVETGGDWRRFALGVIVGGGVLALGVGAWISTWEDEQTLDPEPEVLLITAPIGEVPTAAPPTPAATEQAERPTPANTSADRAGGRSDPLPAVTDSPPRPRQEDEKKPISKPDKGERPPPANEPKPKRVPGPTPAHGSSDADPGEDDPPPLVPEPSSEPPPSPPPTKPVEPEDEPAKPSTSNPGGAGTEEIEIEIDE
jgi:serine/threonine protein kinase